MNIIRAVMSVFLLVLLGLSIAGWFWAGDQPTRYASVGARIAVVLCGLMAIGGMALIWSIKRPASNGPSRHP